MPPKERSTLRSQSNSRLLALTFVGVGLIILGAAAWLLLPRVGLAETAASGSVLPVKVEFEAPELSLVDLNGQAGSLSAYRGKVVLVNNWATWCPPCKAEMPGLQAFYETHRSQGFELIGVEAGETAGEVAQFVKEYGLTFPIWLDPENRSLDAIHNQDLPNSYVIDKLGVVRLAWTGPISREMLEKYVAPLLEE
jgi:peroxiredoxin